jgi:hypothetical protein
MKNRYLLFLLVLSSYAMEEVFEQKSSLISVGSMMTVSNGIKKNTPGSFHESCRIDVFMPRTSRPFACNFMYTRQDGEFSKRLREVYNINNDAVFSYIIKSVDLDIEELDWFFNTLTDKDEFHNKSSNILNSNLENDVLYLVIPDKLIKNKNKNKTTNFLVDHIRQVFLSEESYLNKNNDFLKSHYKIQADFLGNVDTEIINIKNFSNIAILIVEEGGEISKIIQSPVSLRSDFFVDYISDYYYNISFKNINNSGKLDGVLLDTIATYLPLESSRSIDWAYISSFDKLRDLGHSLLRDLGHSLYCDADIYKYLKNFLEFFTEIKITDSIDKSHEQPQGIFFTEAGKSSKIFEEIYDEWKRICLMTNETELIKFHIPSINTSSQIYRAQHERLFLMVHKIKISNEEFKRLESYIEDNKICTEIALQKILEKKDQEIFFITRKEEFHRLIKDI